jgi:hypothetical protein
MFAEEFRVRDTIVILSNGDVEVIGVYESKERCLQILKDICEAYREECYTKEFFDVAVQAIRSAIYQKNAVFELPEK